MKKIFSAFAAAVIAASAVTANASELFASYIYDDTPVQEASYYCIVGLDDDPLAKYDYAQQNGVDEFIFTEEGKTVYEDLLSDHAAACQTMSDKLGREVQKIYDYTAVYNGMSVILTDTEYKEVHLNMKDYGIRQIYLTSYVTDVPEITQNSTDSAKYSDLTDRILEQTGVSKVSQKGDSTVIAVIDDSFDTDHEFLSTMPEGVTGALSEDYINSISPFLSSTSGGGSGYYLNEKIPYRFDYTNHTTNTNDDPTENHGTHVAGIAAGNGYAETDEQYDAKGVAPDAQLVLMSSNLTDQDVMAAYNDCALLGADTINASFGAAYIPDKNAPYEVESLSNLSATGTIFCAAAGNDAKMSYSGADSLLNTDYSAGGYPDGISSVFSVGSAENLVYESKVITVGGNNYELSPATSDITSYLGDTKMEFVAVPGFGYPEDFEGLDLKGKVALVPRGEITFDEKAQNAKDCGAVGLIICNNEPGNSVFTPSCSVLPSGLIGYESYLEITESGENTLTINSDSILVSSMNNKMSSFSSWDYTEKLLLKPDITAYGGNIISSYPGNKYGSMSGTSMASPQMTGITALLKEYLKQNTEKYGIVSNSDYPEMMAKLLMSTATPIYSSDGLEIASPRVQGNGLVNIESAMNTPAYIYTDSEADNCRPKLSLGDNLESNIGSLEFSSEKFYFHIKNVSDTPQTYTLSADLFCDSDEDGELAWNVKKMTESKVLFKSGMTDISEITVAPGEDATVSLDIDLSAEDQQYIEGTFENGTFIDGYVYLKSDSAPNLTLSFMGYYGSWSDSEIFEPFVYNSKENASYSPSVMSDTNGNAAGINTLAAMLGEQITGIPAYSPNGDNVLDDIRLSLGFKRRCYNVSAEIYKGGKRVYTELITCDVGCWTPGYTGPSNFDYPLGWDFEGTADGELYELRLTAETPDVGNGFRREVLSQEFRIDATAPELKECRKLVINGEEYVQLTITDNNAVQGAVLLDETYSAEEPELIDLGYCQETNQKEYSVTLQIPEDSEKYSAEVYDMAGNCTSVDLSKTDDTYYLTYDENMFFSTNEKTFKNKISLTDANGNDVTFGVSVTPEKAYKDNAEVISVIMNSVEIAQIPVTVGLAGDADLNDTTNLYDAIKISKYLLWKNDPNGSFKNEFRDFEGSFGAYLADYDVNGSINLYDAIGIAKLLLPSAK